MVVYARRRGQPRSDRRRVHSRAAGHEGLRHREPLQTEGAYDIYYSIRNFQGGIETLVPATEPLLDSETARTGYLHVSDKFRHSDDFGPTSVRQFVDRPEMLEERTADQWQQDAFGQVDAWLSALGLR